MKLISILLLSLACLLPVSGCKTSNPPTAEARVFDTYVAVYNGAREAVVVAQKLDLQHKLKPGKIGEINELWNAFRAAYRVAFIAANRNQEAVPPADVIRLRDALLRLITESRL